MSKTTRGMHGVVAFLLALTLLLAPTEASAYGGGGGDVGGPPKDLKIDPWKPSELVDIFGNLNPSQQDTLITAFTGSTITKRDLLTIRQVFLEQNSNAANNEAAMLDACVKTLEILDKLGEYSQEGLSFVPGVGWVTAAALGAARGGANAYRDGKAPGDIVKGIVIGGGASGLVGKFSPMNADKAFSTARAGINLARNAITKKVRKRATVVAVKAIARYGAKKGVDYGAEKGIGKAMEQAANILGAENRASVPDYSPDPTFDPMSSAPASPIAGGTPQI
nr:hypothetical protein [uncultured Pseudodesulfovibrio sp.]